MASEATTTLPGTAKVPRKNKKSGKARKKTQFKLRFHHQALPPEYLDHYEATQNDLQKKEALQIKLNQKKNIALESGTVPDEKTNESVRNWLQKISELQKEGVSFAPVKEDVDMEVVMSPGLNKASSKMVSYKDLPYMGEMTLANSKPRRGRKPKKADICHLIYKNYGTILPGTPKEAMECNGGSERVTENTVKSLDIQNKIISSLLEKRLTQDDINPSSNNNNNNSLSNNNHKEIANTHTIASTTDALTPLKLTRLEQPLNLCVRDGDTFLVSSSDEDETDSNVNSARTTPLILPSDFATDTALAANLKMSLPNFQSALLDPTPSPDTPSTVGSDVMSPNSGYVYWPGAGVFIHPMAMYYQKMVDASNKSTLAKTPVPAAQSVASKVESSSNSLTTRIPNLPPPTLSQRKDINPSPKLLIPKNISQLVKAEKSPDSPNGPQRVQSESSSASSKRTTPTTTPTPQKRKRSAIFIPPVPAENSSNPATEVSICKFKFTGGAKPCLQEKKMLSVDSGGNFRYYSGTGDKSMRGYEFFPRESLQQSSLIAGSTAGAFLNTSGERILGEIPSPSLGISSELLQIPEFLPGPSSGQIPLSASTSSLSTPASPTFNDRDGRKRKTRRSLQREKLEKTFKDKGFLIQTQQLESAEGATYCKFRQLRKFTRYLFRSWKDYLPGEFQQNPSQEQLLHAIGDNVDANTIILDSSSLPSPSSLSTAILEPSASLSLHTKNNSNLEHRS